MSSTLADHLRALPGDGLAALFALRPDLLVPVPADTAALAARAQARVSVARALDPLDRFTLEVLDAVRLCRDSAARDSASRDGARRDGAARDGAAPAAEAAVSAEAVVALVSTGRDAPVPAVTRAALDRLRARFLVYGAPDDLRLAAGVDEVCPPYPAGLGRAARDLDEEAAALCADPAGLRRSVLAAPPAARAVLDRLAAGPPLGTVGAAAVADETTPVGWLVAHHLLVPVSQIPAAGGPPGAGGTAPAGQPRVELPREVGLLLRRDVGPLGELHPEPPAIEAPVRAPRTVDLAGAGQAMEAVRRTEALLEAFAAEPVPALRSGGIGVRDLRRMARATGMEEAEAAVLIEVAAGAGLLGEDDPGTSAEERYLPTSAYDLWRRAPIAQRWNRLARAWLALTRQPGLVGRRDERDRLLGALAPDLDRVTAPQVRGVTLAALAGTAPGAAPGEEDLLQLINWRAPRQAGAGRAEQVHWVLTEAAVLGVTAMGALTGYGRLLLDEVLAAARRDPDTDPLGLQSGEDTDAAGLTGSAPAAGGPTGPTAAAATAPAAATAAGGGSAAIRALDKLLPPPVDHVVVQADLTVVVPGPASSTLSADLALVAEAESTNLLRVTTASLRRALDAGYTAADLHSLFARRSRTAIPQALTYLIDDVARRHGGLRIGAAGAYLRSEDETLLLELVADRRLAGLHLRRLAPTVLTSPHSSSRLLSALRDAGYAPVGEDATGATVVARPRARRAPPRRPPVSLTSFVDGPAWVPQARLAAIVEQVRRGDAAARVARRAPVAVRDPVRAPAAQAHTQAMAILQQALRDKQRVWVGYVDAHGATASRLVRPVSIGAGFLRAEDDRTDTLHTFALHRITAAVLEA
jgi:hypothetical protein